MCHPRSSLLVALFTASAFGLACGDGGGARTDTSSDVPDPVDTTDAPDTVEVPDTGPDIDVPPGSLLLTGSVQKGPFVIGSSVTVSPLNASTLQPTGQTFLTNTKNDRGEFEVVFEATGPVSVEGEGYYYNEITGSLSAAELTLRAFFVPTGTGLQEAYLNLVTHLTTERIKALVTGGTAFEAAVAQAEGELFTGLDLTRDGYSPAVAGIRMNVLGGDSEDNAYLLLMSATLLQTANARPAGSLEAKIQELLNQMALDLADGTLEASLRVEIAAALSFVDLTFVETQLAARFTQIGSTQPVPDVDVVADQDGDGLANSSDNCPKANNANQGNGDGDRFGDVCDICPTTDCDGLCIAGAGGAPDACFATCASDADCAGETCLSVPAQGLADPGNPEGGRELRFCGPTCDPRAPACDATETCAFAWGADANYRWSCVPTALVGDTGAGSGCTMRGLYCVDSGCAPLVTECEAGLVCWCGPELACTSSSVYMCRTVCDPANPGAVCGEEACTATGGDLGLCEVGLGQLGDACAPGMATCAPNLACSWDDALCGDGDHGAADQGCCVPAGGLGEACFEDNSCSPGLMCGERPDLCAQGRCCREAGGLGQACFEDRTCDDGFACDRCGDGGPGGPAGEECCVPAGGLDEPCLSDGTCDPGFGCVNDWGVCGEFRPNCCKTAAGPLAPCATQPCTADYVCASAGSVCAAGEPCCVPRPDLGEDCYDSPICPSGAYCAADVACASGSCCAEAGAIFTPCNRPNDNDPRCQDGFACVGSDICLPYTSSGSCPCADPDTTCMQGFVGPDWMSVTVVCVNKAEEGQFCEGLVTDNRSVSLGCATGLCMTQNPMAAPEEWVCPPLVALALSNSQSWGCCVGPVGDGEACFGRAELCEASLACVYTGNPALCPSGVDYCCRAPGALGARCVGNACATGAACFEGWCVASSGRCTAGGAAGSETCANPAYVCDFNRCLSWGAMHEPCGPAPTNACDTGALSCVEGVCTTTGGDGEPCNSNGGCDTAELSCVGSLCRETGGVDEPCNTDSSCDVGLSCNYHVNPARCEEAGSEGEACLAGQLCDAGFTCIENDRADDCTTNDIRCCYPSGDLGEPCNSDGTCNGVTLACKNIDVPSLPWNRECVTGQAIGQPCDADYPCVGAGFCATNTAVCGAGVTCCQARQPVGGACEGDPARCLAGLNCKATSFDVCPDGLNYCCVEAGEPGQACTWPTNGCDTAGYACLGGRCVLAGGSGEPCNPGNLCDSGNLACIDGVCRATLGACGIGGSCPGGSSCRQSVCLESGGLWQACNASGDACDVATLTCQTTWSAPMGACLNDWPTCCQPVPLGP